MFLKSSSNGLYPSFVLVFEGKPNSSMNADVSSYMPKNKRKVIQKFQKYPLLLLKCFKGESLCLQWEFVFSFLFSMVSRLSQSSSSQNNNDPFVPKAKSQLGKIYQHHPAISIIQVTYELWCSNEAKSFRQVVNLQWRIPLRLDNYCNLSYFHLSANTNIVKEFIIILPDWKPLSRILEPSLI